MCVDCVDECTGFTPLNWAAQEGHAKVAIALLESGAAKDAVDHAGWTPLHRAAHNGRPHVCRALLAVGANPGYRGNCGRKPIDVLCGARGADRSNRAVIQALLEAADS